jgi:hypothetical protein
MFISYKYKETEWLRKLFAIWNCCEWKEFRGVRLMRRASVCILLPVAIGLLVNLSISQTTEKASRAQTAENSNTSQVAAAKLWMKSWGEDEKVDISPQAQDLINTSLKENKSKIAMVGVDRVWKDSDRTVGQTLVNYYLADLRDLDAQKAGSSTGEWKPASIKSSDVQAYPLDEFLRKLDPVLNGPNGELHVVSKPTGASIVLDKSSRGNTGKITVERAGKHRIVVKSKVLSCSDDINIPDGGSVTFHCP